MNSASATTDSTPLEISVIPSTISASSSFLKVRTIPIFSISSDVSLIPAVSIKRNNVPSMLNVSSIVSLVVPAMSETIARSSPRIAFRSVLLPVFVAPAIATGMPFLIALPSLNESASVVMCDNVPSTSALSCSLLANSTSSSLKSSSNSSREVILSSSSRRDLSSLEYPPFNWFMATL